MVTRVGFCVSDTAVTMLQIASSVISDDTNNIDMVIIDIDPGEDNRRLEITGTPAMDIRTLHTPNYKHYVVILLSQSF